MHKHIVDYWKKLNTIPCDECGCRVRHEVIKDTISGVVCSTEIHCVNCGYCLNYWAFGYKQYPETYTKLIKIKWGKIKTLICTLFRRL
jgi:uncharacterized Zn finger protein